MIIITTALPEEFRVVATFLGIKHDITDVFASSGEIMVVQTGMGSMASVCALADIPTHKIDRILNVGYCAAVGYDIGSIVIPRTIVNANVDVPEEWKSLISKPIKLSGADSVLMSSDRFVTKMPDNCEPFCTFDMEAYAQAYWAFHHKIKFDTIKVVSDRIDKGSNNIVDFHNSVSRDLLYYAADTVKTLVHSYHTTRNK